MMPSADLTTLQQKWKTLFSVTLPALAKAADPAQSRWPVHLDHCFARIILDNTVGDGKQKWDEVINKPAIRSMNESQLLEAIDLGEKIQRGQVDLVELDEQSLATRGKQSKLQPKKKSKVQFKSEEGQFIGKKRKVDNAADDADLSPRPTKKQSTLSFNSKNPKPQLCISSTQEQEEESVSDTAELMPTYARIQSHPNLTPYRKRLYAALLTVPRGRYTTYAAMSDYLSSSARAVGNGMRNNPFAPDVPCHRVLAADGSLGGFYGSWGKDGKFAKEKIELLRGEGVVFDSKGKVKGNVWKGFYELGDTG